MNSLKVILALLTTISIPAFAGGKCPAPGALPYGGRTDYTLAQNWQAAQDQHFPILPAQKDLKDEPYDPSQLASAPRYIFHMDVGSLQNGHKPIFCENGYFYFFYKNKEQGQLALVALPKWRKCFDNLKAKFSEMQWVVLNNGPADSGVHEIVLEAPRQCTGDFKETGSKLSTAKAALQN